MFRFSSTGRSETIIYFERESHAVCAQKLCVSTIEYSSANKTEKSYLKLNSGYLYQMSFRVVIESEDFLDVPLSILQQFLSDNAINIKREEQIFTAGLKWLKHDESRSEHGFEVLNCVRLARVAPRFLLDMVEVEEIFNNEKCRQVINQAKVCINLHSRLYPTDWNKLSDCNDSNRSNFIFHF